MNQIKENLLTQVSELASFINIFLAWYACNGHDTDCDWKYQHTEVLCHRLSWVPPDYTRSRPSSPVLSLKC